MSLRPVKARDRARTQKTKPLSSQTQKLLHSMMAKSRLTPAQKRKLKAEVASSGRLPASVQPPPRRKARPRITREIRGRVPLSSRPSIRPKEAILDSDPYAVDKFVPQRGLFNSQVAKAELADRFEDEGRPEEKKVYGPAGRKNKARRDAAARAAAHASARAASAPQLDERDILAAEIQERAEFLEDMRALGAAADYESTIKFQISQRVQRMKLLDAQDDTSSSSQQATRSTTAATTAAPRVPPPHRP